MDRPESLWRRSGAGWEYLSLIDWYWHPLDDRQVVARPLQRVLVPVPAGRAWELAGDWQRWVRYWALYRPVHLGGSREPINVVRRRVSPEDLRDEAVRAAHGWVWVSVLREVEDGMSSNDRPIRVIAL